jgi:uncharacterized caspase-like protein
VLEQQYKNEQAKAAGLSTLIGKRVALVIGNSAYKNTPVLSNPRNDAIAFGDALRRLGFEVDIQVDLDKVGMDNAVRRFGDRLQDASVALFYYAGHGIEVNGINYLVPTNAELARERDVYYQAVDVDLVLREMDGEDRISLMFLDACRNNPLAMKLRSTTRAIVGNGLAPMQAPTGMMISYATKEGEVAEDGSGKNSPYTTALLKHLDTPGIEVGVMLRRVREEVLKVTNKRQTPTEYGSLLGEFYFKPAMKDLPSVASQEHSPEIDALFWRFIQDSKDPEDFKLYLNKLPNGIFADLARRTLDRLDPPAPEPEAAMLPIETPVEAPVKK